MQIIIDIDEEIYKARQHLVANPKRMVNEVDIAIANGTPIPKGHGRLIDADELKQVINSFECYDQVLDAPTIIEADRSEKT